MTKQKTILIGLFLLAIIIIILNGLPFYTKFSGSEIVGPIKYLSDHIPIHKELYSNHVLQYKSQLPIIQFFEKMTGFFDIPPYRVDHLNYFLSTFLVFVAIYLFLNRFAKMNEKMAVLISLAFVLFNPLRGLYYGYHYKIGMAGATFGLMAFSLITFLFYALITRKILLHAFFLILLYFVHPLNALLYFGFVFFYLSILFYQKIDRHQIARFSAFNLVCLLPLVLPSLSNYTSLYSDDPSKIFQLIWLVNSPGGYFYSWMNPEKLSKAILFFPSFFFFLWMGHKRGFFEKQLFVFALSFSVFALGLCLLNFLAYQIKFTPLLPLDISRVFALQIPLVFVCMTAALFHLWNQKDQKNLAALGILLFVCVRSQFLLFPFLIWPILYGKKEQIRLYSAIFIPIMVVLTLIRFEDNGFKWLDFNMQTNKVSPLLLVISLLILVMYPVLKKGARIALVALLVASFVIGYRYKTEWWQSLINSRENERNYQELAEFINSHTNPSDIFLADDSIFVYNYLRNHFITYHYTAYSAYMGRLDLLEKEAKLVWNFDLTPEFIEKFKASCKISGLRLEKHMINTLKSYTASHLRQVREIYPAFRYILMEQENLSFANSLPLKRVFENKRFVLFELKKT